MSSQDLEFEVPTALFELFNVTTSTNISLRLFPMHLYVEEIKQQKEAPNAAAILYFREKNPDRLLEGLCEVTAMGPQEEALSICPSTPRLPVMPSEPERSQESYFITAPLRSQAAVHCLPLHLYLQPQLSRRGVIRKDSL